MQEELLAEERMIETGTAFVTFMPYASLSPYHTWIFPRKHQAAFDEISDAEIEELAGMLSRLLRRLKAAADAPDYNITIRSAPLGEGSSGCFHWYLSVVSRISQLAGLNSAAAPTSIAYSPNSAPNVCVASCFDHVSCRQDSGSLHSAIFLNPDEPGRRTRRREKREHCHISSKTKPPLADCRDDAAVV